ncbi:hypothetical protein J6590_003371 [Homalodisca vitripennis]|nr:hypothetical protein J6590_003371 [Homalodisca vitripennis]
MPGIRQIPGLNNISDPGLKIEIQGRNRRNTLNQWRSPVGDGSKLQSRRSAAVQWGVGVQL